MNPSERKIAEVNLLLDRAEGTVQKHKEAGLGQANLLMQQAKDGYAALVTQLPAQDLRDTQNVPAQCMRVLGRMEGLTESFFNMHVKHLHDTREQTAGLTGPMDVDRAGGGGGFLSAADIMGQTQELDALRREVRELREQTERRMEEVEEEGAATGGGGTAQLAAERLRERALREAKEYRI